MKSGEGSRFYQTWPTNPLYPSLHRMEQAGWIAAEWRITENNRRARLYRLTRAGQQRLNQELEKWDSLSRAVGKILRFA
jgi:PadR family transcriptional regulator, regulatory protein PadR